MYAYLETIRLYNITLFDRCKIVFRKNYYYRCKIRFYFSFFICYTTFVDTEPFGGTVNQIRKNAQEENKNKHISYNANTVFNSKEYLVC